MLGRHLYFYIQDENQQIPFLYIRFFKMTTNFFFLYFSRGEYLVYSSYSDTLPPEVLQRQWKKQKFHYDTVPTAMLTLFAVQTTEGWPVYV